MALTIILGFFALLVFTGQLVTFWLNLTEFDDLFVRPFYYALVAGIVLSPIALFRIDFKNRRSLTWWVLKLVFGSLRRQSPEEGIPVESLDFSGVKLSPVKFALWQLTKVMLGLIFFGNVLFGFTVSGILAGWESGLGSVWRIFALPFSSIPPNMSYAQSNVIPMIPSLTLVITPILGALGLRLVILVGITQLVRIATSTYVNQARGIQTKFPSVAFQSLIALGSFWTAFNLFFPSFIDFNTRYLITSLLAFGGVMLVFALYDKFRIKPLLRPPRRSMILRVLTVILVLTATASVVAVNNSIADARKVEWRGPYTAQQIAVNRYLAELDQVAVVPYNFSISPVPPGRVDDYVAQNKELLGRIRLWDWEAAFAKLKPEIGLIPYVDFQDSDILRFNGSLYWSASMKTVLPPTVRAEDRWYASHLVYTHVPSGFLILDGHAGTISDTSQFFQQRKIYYGEGGLLQEAWAGYPVGRQVSDELGGYFYGGTGGVDMPPPLSWIFEPNFLLSYPGSTIRALRYQDVYERMQMLFPYFIYEFQGKRIDMLPVTDGSNTFWLMPLMIGLEGRNIPWSSGNPMIRLVGYALIDTYHGSLRIIVTGKDFFSDLFKHVYSDYVTTEVPNWLYDQIRYPEELFRWRMEMFSFFHITDPSNFIVAKEFLEVPKGLVPYYVMTQPPGFSKPEFLGLLSLELRGGAGRNLAGYVTVRNDYPRLGELTFYRVALDSPTKLLGPTAIVEALERNPDFATFRTLLRNPRLGDNILYRVGDHDVYFIPVYTAGAGGVVAEIGGVAAVGAVFTGEYHVGFGRGGSPEEAFKAYLAKFGGIDAPPPKPEVDKEKRLEKVEALFTAQGLTIVKPTALSPTLTFKEGETRYVDEDQWGSVQGLVEKFLKGTVEPRNVARIISWADGARVNFGVLVLVEGVYELHFVSVDLG
ncbi:MAG: UPF0182 family protein [Thaumarchaeota archaeon]|nr:UPF0182 family protein [Nitrososphaerota archaeon]